MTHTEDLRRKGKVGRARGWWPRRWLARGGPALAVTTVALLVAPCSAAPAPNVRTLNFDDVTASCYFKDSVPLTTQYQTHGVVFSGPSATSGGAILSATCGYFGVTGYSAPNVLAFNAAGAFRSGGSAIAPEMLDFVKPVNSITIAAAHGTGATGSLMLTAFNSAAPVAENGLTLTSTLTPVSVSAPRITSVRIVSTADVFVLDDLSFTLAPQTPGSRAACKHSGYHSYVNPASGKPFRSESACLTWVDRYVLVHGKGAKQVPPGIKHTATRVIR